MKKLLALIFVCIFPFCTKGRMLTPLTGHIVFSDTMEYDAD